MNLVIIILIVIAAIVALVIIAALIAPKGYHISRSVVIDAPLPQVFNYISYLKKQDHFNKWTMMDPNMKKEFRGTDGAVGSVYAWEGNKQAGKGEQEIVNIIPNRQVDLEVRFIRPMSGIMNTSMITEEAGPGKTRVTWDSRSRMKFPTNAFLLVMKMDKLLGPDLQASLEMLKAIHEKK